MIPAPVPALLLVSLFLCRPALCAEPYMPSLDSLYASGLPVLFVDTDSMALPTADPVDTPESVLRMSNLWDFDTMMRHEATWSRQHSFFYFPMLFASPNSLFTESYIRIWEEEGHAVVDSTIRYMREYACSDEGHALAASLALDHERWPIYSVRFDEYADSVVRWLEERKSWMDVEITRMKTSLSVSRTVPDGHEREDVHYYDMFGRRREEEREWRFMKRSRDGRTGIVF